MRELIKSGKDKLEIIDVREPEEYKAIRIKGSKLIPLNELPDRMGEIDWDKEVVFICRSGSRSNMAASLFAGSKDIKNLQYGIYEYYKDGGENLEIDSGLIKGYF